MDEIWQFVKIFVVLPLAFALVFKFGYFLITGEAYVRTGPVSCVIGSRYDNDC